MVSYFRKQHLTAPLDNLPEAYVAQDGGQGAVDDRDLLLRLLSLLSVEERELVLLKYQQGLRNVDIAERLNMNASTVSTMLSRALAKMREAAERNA